MISKELSDFDNTYRELYLSFENDEIISILSTLHNRIVNSFNLMNDRLPATEKSNRHFWAAESRILKKTIEMAIDIESNFKNTEFSFSIDKEYRKLFDNCLDFLEKSGGSTLPIGMKRIEPYYIIPIFNLNNTHIKKYRSRLCELKEIGEGSFAKVFKYKDLDYDKFFCLKQAKKDISDNEKTRFIKEFDYMKELKSPYILEVYQCDNAKYEYTMEYMDFTLLDYIKKKNSTLTKDIRRSIGLQIIKSIEYLWSKNILHRDLSPNNVLLKIYDDSVVCKISDFGLIKINESNLTNPSTEIKGSFNDISDLQRIGFNNYDKPHEIFALTKLLYFVATGKTNLDNQNNNFLLKGLNSNTNARFKNLQELKSEFLNLLNSL